MPKTTEDALGPHDPEPEQQNDEESAEPSVGMAEEGEGAAVAQGVFETLLAALGGDEVEVRNEEPDG